MTPNPNDPHGQATFRGQAQDHDGRPIEGFVRVFHGDSPYTSRKITGAFLLQMPPGHYRIEVHADGYQPVQIKLILHSQQGAAHQFIMNKIWHGDAADRPREVPAPVFPEATELSPESRPELSPETRPDQPPEQSIEEMLYSGDEKDS